MSLALILQRISEVEHELEVCKPEYRAPLYELLDKLVNEYWEVKGVRK